VHSHRGRLFTGAMLCISAVLLSKGVCLSVCPSVYS